MPSALLLPLLPLLLPQAVQAQPTVPRARSSEIGWARPVGLGATVGSPTGLSAKVYLDRRAEHAIDGSLSFHGVGQDAGGVMFQTGYHWHPGTLIQTAVVEVPWRLGAGVTLGDTGWNYQPRLGSGLPTPQAGPVFAGVRGVVGLDAALIEGPLQLTADLSTQLSLVPGAWWGLGASVGARYYFCLRRGCRAARPPTRSSPSRTAGHHLEVSSTGRHSSGTSWVSSASHRFPNS